MRTFLEERKMTINKRMFEIMEIKQIKPINLANTLGISKSVVSTWKSRGTNPPIEYTERICELLGVTIEYFITGKEENKTYTDEEKELIKNYRELSEKNKGKVEGYIYGLSNDNLENSEKEKLSESKIG